MRIVETGYAYHTRPFPDFTGPVNFTKPTIEFDEEQELYVKQSILVLEGKRFLGLTPWLHISGTTYECVVDCWVAEN